MGENCMRCHVQGGKGKGSFQVAGTVYKNSSGATYPNATVKLYTGQNGTGTLMYTIEVDGLGNFYTTDFIDFTIPLYPAVTGNNGTEYMGNTIATGQCNNCHNNNTEPKIWTD